MDYKTIVLIVGVIVSGALFYFGYKKIRAYEERYGIGLICIIPFVICFCTVIIQGGIPVLDPTKIEGYVKGNYYLSLAGNVTKVSQMTYISCIVLFVVAILSVISSFVFFYLDRRYKNMKEYERKKINIK